MSALACKPFQEVVIMSSSSHHLPAFPSETKILCISVLLYSNFTFHLKNDSWRKALTVKP